MTQDSRQLGPESLFDDHTVHGYYVGARRGSGTRFSLIAWNRGELQREREIRPRGRDEREREKRRNRERERKRKIESQGTGYEAREKEQSERSIRKRTMRC